MKGIKLNRMSRFSPEEPSSVKQTRIKDCAPRSQSWAHRNSIADANNVQSPLGCWGEGHKLLTESPLKSTIPVMAGEHMWK